MAPGPLEGITWGNEFLTWLLLISIDCFLFNKVSSSSMVIFFIADHDNHAIVAYLITHMEMEFRKNLFQKCLEAHDRKLPRILLPFLPLKYSKGANNDDLHFSFKT